MITTTYYECIGDDGQPTAPKQRKLKGTTAYGYKTRLRAELNCPNGASVQERHTDGANDWPGRIVSYRGDSTGTLYRVVE